MNRPAALLDLRQMEEAAHHARAYCTNLTHVEFLAHRKTRHADLFTLLLIGEAAARLLARRPDMTARYKDIPWRDMKGMRNRIVHAYCDLDHDTIWTTVDQDLPRLIDALSLPLLAASHDEVPGASPG